ncbi:DMT family transporter [Pseudomonas stutzeri]|uniref:EamA family transporter n=1 Tax=Stutzerimonas stutzeri TaxID=316 RepID=A0A2N8T0Y5_STUST|nr:DMT family transporter [Stutzerimonas stutzeri]EQM72292.1 membrane protein [Stutzerimonas stutzeri MF28]MCQ4251418.1 DMT family transporter [Stutzerimonas stutzeri]PNG08397.1 EamA family transporter [Stutzerimonas stutzeri]
MTARTLLLTALAMLAFAGNSLLCRAALRDSQIDPASFTALRLFAGALVLWLLLYTRKRAATVPGNWAGALSLFIYAAAFSYAYLHLDAGAGALLLFGAVQLSMIAWGLLRGERLHRLQVVGLVLAAAGLVALLLPGTSTPSLSASCLMVLAGIAWGAYSLLGKGTPDPLAATAGNFIRTLPIVAVLCLVALGSLEWDSAGVVYALLSGALTSGIGYAIWYAAMPGLAAIQAASVQLSVPLLTALAGSVLLGESLTGRLMLAGVAILGGIALVLRYKHRT